jgi:hypothetical protein
MWGWTANLRPSEALWLQPQRQTAKHRSQKRTVLLATQTTTSAN